MIRRLPFLGLILLTLGTALWLAGCQASDSAPPASAELRTARGAATAADTLLSGDALAGGIEVMVNADTFVQRSRPHTNFGDRDVLKVKSDDERLALIRVDGDMLAAASGGRQVVGAYLELTALGDAQGAGSGERELALYLMEARWTEAGATWDCADDADSDRAHHGCDAEDRWQLAPHVPRVPWRAPASDRQRIGAPFAGTVVFDVTADVLSILAGDHPNHGWLLRLDRDPGRDRDRPQHIDFASREAEAGAPRLVFFVAEPAEDDPSHDAGLDTAPVDAADDTELPDAPPDVVAAELCANAVDDDGDGRIDCSDLDCLGEPSCARETCDNGVDDDRDGLIDCDDADCCMANACADEPPPAVCLPVAIAPSQSLERFSGQLVDVSDVIIIPEYAFVEAMNAADFGEPSSSTLERATRVAGFVRPA